MTAEKRRMVLGIQYLFVKTLLCKETSHCCRNTLSLVQFNLKLQTYFNEKRVVLGPQMMKNVNGKLM